MRRLAPLLALLASAACSSAPSRLSPPVPERVAPGLRTQTADQQVAHVLSRLTFGARPGDVGRVRAMGVDRWIDEQLHPERLDDSRAEGWLGRFEVLQKSSAELESEYQNPGALQQQLAARNNGVLSAQDSMQLRAARQKLRRVVDETQITHVARALLTERQLEAVMTDFWLNHFTVFAGKGIREQFYLADYENRVIRPRALGKFRDLLGAVAKSPAMLFYLDNWESAADSGRPRLQVVSEQQAQRALQQQFRAQQQRTRQRPGARPLPAVPQELAQQVLQRRLRGGLNENYGRELLELHTLGVDGGYTQQDVINGARALTGWTIAGPQRGGGFTFAAYMHDAGEKFVLGHRLAAGRGIEDGEELLDIVARHPSTARFIAFKLARRFVSDTPPAALVERAAATYNRTDGDIREVVRTIVTSPEFFSHEAYRAKVKSPTEVVLSALRAVDAQPDSTLRTAQLIAGLGQPVFGHQTPDGWPETGDKWMGTGAILNRINFGLVLASGRVPGATAAGFPNFEGLRQAPREQQVDAAIAAFLGGDASTITRAVLITGKNPLLEAAAADTAAMSPPRAAPMSPPRAEPMMPPPASGVPAARPGQRLAQARATAPLPNLNGLPQVIGLALGSPEFQRR
jgi:uncharacterized protein (DUF1800 family)